MTLNRPALNRATLTQRFARFGEECQGAEVFKRAFGPPYERLLLFGAQVLRPAPDKPPRLVERRWTQLDRAFKRARTPDQGQRQVGHANEQTHPSAAERLQQGVPEPLGQRHTRYVGGAQP